MACLVHSLTQLCAALFRDEKMRWEALVDGVAIAAAAAFAVWYYKWWAAHPLYGQNRGSKAYPVLGTIITYLRNRHRLLDCSTELLIRTPGHTTRAVRPGGGVYHMTADPANVEHILKTNFGNYPKGAFLNANLRDLLGDGIFNADDHVWKIQRKAASHEFSTRSLSDFVLGLARRETAERLLPVLSHAAHSGRAVDLQDVFSRFAFDNICQLGFGVDPACLDLTLPDVRFAAAFDAATSLTVARAQTFPRTVWTVQQLLDVGAPRALRLAVGVIDKFAMDVIRRRRTELAAGTCSTEDLLSRFMSLVDGEPGEEIGALLSDEGRKRVRGRNSADIFLRDIVISFILAGRDTSTAALSSFFWLLSANPRVEAAILDELSKVGRSGHELSFQELKSLHYLHAALTESMRLYPPVPVDYKTARNADVLPDGTAIAANSFVGYHQYAMGRLEGLWGKDCLEFRPERWLSADGAFVAQSPYKYTVFHAGPRMCLGKDMVMMQMKLVSAAVLGTFEVAVPSDYEAHHVPLLTLRLKDGLPVTVKNRTSVPLKTEL